MPAISPLPYNNAVPVATNNPSQDVNDMTINAGSIDSIWQTDHYTFGIINPGSHKQVQLAEAASAGNGALPTPLIGTGYEVLYASLTNSVGEVWLSRGGGTGIRLTGPGTPTPVSSVSGYTFVPGGFILQWGVANFTAGTGTQNFSFTTPFIVGTTINLQATCQLFTFPSNFAFSANVVNSTTFSITVSVASPNPTPFWWLAIGN